MSNLTPPVQHRMQCVEGAACTRRAPGHVITPAQLLATSAQPQAWSDALVVEVDAEGFVTLALCDFAAPAHADCSPQNNSGTPDAEGGRVHTAIEPRVTLWSHSASALAAGTPVALNARFGTLAVGPQRLSVVVVGPDSDIATETEAAVAASSSGACPR